MRRVLITMLTRDMRFCECRPCPIPTRCYARACRCCRSVLSTHRPANAVTLPADLQPGEVSQRARRSPISHYTEVRRCRSPTLFKVLCSRRCSTPYLFDRQKDRQPPSERRGSTTCACDVDRTSPATCRIGPPADATSLRTIAAVVRVYFARHRQSPSAGTPCDFARAGVLRA